MIMPSGSVNTDKVFSVAGHPQNTAVLMDIISKLKYDLKQCNNEKQKLAEQLNCFITLVKRSWEGDHNAALHLGNIVGVMPPVEWNNSYDGKLRNTPVPGCKTRAVMNWERFAIKLLELDYARMQDEIHYRQQLHLQNRNLYMDAVLNSHENEMSKFPLHRRKKMDEIDQRFLKTYNKNPGMNKKPSRVKSAPASRQAKNMVEGKNITLNDLLVKPAQNVSSESNRPFSGLYQFDNEQTSYYDPVSYDDPKRYKQNNLFDLDTVFGPDDPMKKPRPISAFMPRERNATKSRPTSAGVFVTQKNERPLKYESTRPFSGKGKKNNKKSQRLRSASEPFINFYEEEEEKEIQEETANGNNENENVSFEEELSDTEETTVKEDLISPALRVRVKSAVNRPQHVDKFVNDMQQMAELEKDFQKTAIELQKKLGISEMGMVK
ncbi:hypothetical protein KUTeg_019191 [Tegillarca granosa]|uniref:Uncharacterized protein n=1 Tax=Tegillarca granosa TaxID=220873 RepID=A0ABQ9EC91_TEGGR|nr:hypothetical protein KUTeg_019191 [Tegillarca granosa]